MSAAAVLCCDLSVVLGILKLCTKIVDMIERTNNIKSKKDDF